MEVPIHGGISASMTHIELSFEECLSRLRHLELIEKGAKVALASKSLNLGSTDELNFEVLKTLKDVERILKPDILSESFSWSALDGHHSYLELPIPLTEANLELLVERVFRIQECLGRKLAIRNLHAPVQFVGAEFTQAEFLYELARITSCDIVLDHGVPDIVDYSIIPSDFIKLHRVPVRHSSSERISSPVVVYGGSFEEQVETLKKIFTAQILNIQTDRMALEGIARRPVELNEGIFESEPRKILLEEITRGFGIRPQADLAVFEGKNPRDGLSQYNQQYFIQVRNVLQNQFRSLAFLLSGQFDRIVVDFLIQYPPADAFISRVGRDFEYFLRENTQLPQHDLLADLTSLEYSIFEIMEEPDHPSVDQGVMMEIASDLWDRVIFKLNDKVRLVESNYDVAKIQKSLLAKGKIPDSPKPHKSYFLVYRLREKPCVQLVGRPEAKAFKYACNEMTFIKICERISSEEGFALDQVIQQTFSFIHRWAGLGLVKAFEFKAPQQVIPYEGTAWDHDHDINTTT